MNKFILIHTVDLVNPKVMIIDVLRQEKNATWNLLSGEKNHDLFSQIRNFADFSKTKILYSVVETEHSEEHVLQNFLTYLSGGKNVDT